ncbi:MULTISPECIES: chemotaxis protein CheA [unclassified Brevundimonas]|uniref:chemotaxis protein CheA n=1 Tax=unclassified Brevundimonas TaxID=2622653 RepID=UPI000CFBC4C4|nr:MULTISPECIES: chemotaxis protein CheA [unclassified Brevundimonas]PRA27758.1 chemotaxis protein CheA [Brevundimonas sp. MYb27]PQZ81081.1 chemotaxis protein CheA [Brevundimonas sp. MYb31]PRB15352.1 chemotaxis protein CheA [Brevundimonas sp. MYb52]PRB35725.1 chemotaxis protein CheA [Brevundimonas sp. MYb46]PRB42776.1 chemotaxis protein CheA [Brevundimonas sp. MYb33]
MSDDPFEAIKVTFFQECSELLGDLEANLLALETGQGDAETINAVFRAVHSVKGGAGAFGLEDLVRFAHVFETLMDELRSGRKDCDDVTVKTLLRASDVLADHIAAAQGTGAPVDAARSAGLVAELEVLTHGVAASVAPAPVAAAADEDDFGFTPLTLDLADFGAPAELPSLDLPPLDLPDLTASSAAPPTVGWRIVFRPHPRLYASANDVSLLLRELTRLGPTSVELDDSGLPMLDALDAEDAHLIWTITLSGDASEAAVRDVFDFVEMDCDLSITALGDAVVETDLPPLPVPDAAPAEPEFDIAALLAKAAAPVEAPAPAPVVATPAPVAPAPVAAAPKPVAHAAPAPAAPSAPAAAAPVTIRVDLDRVDRLINVVGELVIQQAMLAQRVMESGLARSSDIALGLEDLELLTRDIQDSVMAIRAQPVKSVFQRMPRLVREVADMTGKRVRLVTSGEDTEVDKTVVERLAEPITHMLRNAIDHGLESPEEREAAGKPAEGTVRLAALHRSGRIVIEIADDGKGINRPRVRGIAVDRGLIAEDAVLTDDEVDNLIFLPGFSTAETVTDVSGRGVGMDVVKRSIQALGGRISISSAPGKGSTFTLSLPLTLAVLDGMVVDAAEQTLVAPLSAIVESLTPRVEDIHYVGGHDAVIRFREAFVPLVDVGRVMGFRDDATPLSGGVVMIVETEAGARAALLVDAINGQRQVVIKSLETHYRHVDGVSAATILGDGSVALILDIDALVTAGRRKPNRPELKMAS